VPGVAFGRPARLTTTARWILNPIFRLARRIENSALMFPLLCTLLGGLSRACIAHRRKNWSAQKEASGGFLNSFLNDQTGIVVPQRGPVLPAYDVKRFLGHTGPIPKPSSQEGFGMGL